MPKKTKAKKPELSNADLLKQASKELLTASPYGVSAEEAIRKGNTAYTNKPLFQYSVHPKQAKKFQEMAVKAGFRNITFTPDGKCHCDSRKEHNEYAYFRNKDICMDGGYYETISPSRQRELDRIRELG